MSSDSPELGKGLFGYRRSAVNQILSDRDVMLRQAEGRVRAAESKVAELEVELSSFKERNNRMDEQLERLRTQIDALAAKTDPDAAPDMEAIQWHQGTDSPWEAPPSPGPEGEAEALARWHLPESDEPAVPTQDDRGFGIGFGQTEAAFPGLDGLPLESGETGPEPDSESGYLDREALGETVTEEPMDDGEALPTWLDFDRTAQPLEEGSDDLAYGHYGTRASEGEEPSLADIPFAFPQDEDADEASGSMEEPASEVLSTDEPTAAPAAVPHVAQADQAPPAVAEPGVSTQSIDLTNRFLTDEIQGILSAAEDSAARIVERARTTSQHQIAQSNRLWREVQAEVSRFASWREQVEPVIRSVQSKVEGVRTEIDSVPERIRQALAPMADSISTIDTDLAELAAACSPPLLLTPGGLEREGDLGMAWEEESPDDGSEQGEVGAFDETSEWPDGALAEGEDPPGHLAG